MISFHSILKEEAIVAIIEIFKRTILGRVYIIWPIMTHFYFFKGYVM